MSQQSLVLVVSGSQPMSLAIAMGDTRTLPLVEVGWPEAAAAVDRVKPAAIVAVASGSDDNGLDRLAADVAGLAPYVPLIAIDPQTPLPPNVLPFSQIESQPERLGSRLRAALRVRALHATVLRRIADRRTMSTTLSQTDPLDDATVLLIGRGASYPALSIALGERLGVMGALSMEAAGKHLNTRDIDGIVVGDGFSPRVIDAFLTVLSEDARFRNLPVALRSTSASGSARHDLPNLEMVTGDAALLAANALPLIRQQAFEARLARMLASIDAGGMLDPRTGLLTQDAFDRDLETAVEQTLQRRGGLSVARFVFNTTRARALFDAARIFGRTMRKIDFATLRDDGSIIIVFAETELRDAHVIGRRLASIVKHTLHGPGRDTRIDPHVTLATLLPNDTAPSILARVHGEARRAAS